MPAKFEIPILIVSVISLLILLKILSTLSKTPPLSTRFRSSGKWYDEQSDDDPEMKLMKEKWRVNHQECTAETSDSNSKYHMECNKVSDKRYNCLNNCVKPNRENVENCDMICK